MSRELSPVLAEIGLDFRATTRMRPAAKISAISARRLSAVEEGLDAAVITAN
jgi:hypothetical protein